MYDEEFSRKMQDGIVVARSSPWSGRDWRMQFNLKYICEGCGVVKKAKYYDMVDGKPVTKYARETVVKIPQVRKIFRFIRKNLEQDQLQEVEAYVKDHGNPAAWKMWCES